MGRIVLVRPGPGAPDALSLEAWHALTTARAFAVPSDPLGERLRELGYDVAELSGVAGPPPGGLKGTNLLAHQHGALSPEARATADRLAELAADGGDVAFIAPDEDVVRAVMDRALTDGLEVEIVIGRQPRGHRLLELVRVMARLRGPDGCPWDAEQTHQTLAKHLLDETYELLAAIEEGDDAELAEELGDLLLQVVFHAQMGTDAGTFDIDDVAEHITTKLVRRHPHVFGDVEVSGAREVVENWDAIKQHEKQRASAIDGVPEALPALAYAQKLQRRAGAVGFDWTGVEGAIAKVREEAEELARADTGQREHELGDLLLALTALARHLELDAETALRRAARRFAGRFRRVEEAAVARGADLRALDEAELVAMWNDARS